MDAATFWKNASCELRLTIIRRVYFDDERVGTLNIKDQNEFALLPDAVKIGIYESYEFKHGYKDRTFGDRLGEMIVEYSECLTDEQKAAVLEQLSESTADAWGEAAIQVAAILREFGGL